MSRRTFRPALIRRGLTLIELVVVMVILAAVAGIVLPLLPNMVTRAHTTSSATNISEAVKIIQLHEGMHQSYPTNFDSLTLTPAGTGTLPAYLPGTADLAVTGLTDETAESLTHAGILGVRTMVADAGGDWSPTVYPYGADATVVPAVTAIAEDVQLATLLPAAAARLGLLNDADVQYVVVGLGGYTSMQGKSLQEAPIHFADSPAEAPNLMYARYGVVFQVTNEEGDALERAKLAQVVAFHDDGIEGLGAHLKEYFETTQN